MAERKIDDTGELVLGARKHAFGHGLVREDLEGLSPEEAANLVTKENVWPVVDWQAHVDTGVDREVAAFAKVIRDKLANAPNLQARRQINRSGDDVRADYIRMVSIIRDKAMAMREVDDAKYLHDAIIAEISPTPRLDGAAWALVDTAITGRSLPTYYGGKEQAKARSLVEAGFPGATSAPAYLRGVTFRRAGVDGSTMVALKGRRVVASGFSTEDDGKLLLKQQWEAGRAAKADGPKEPPSRAALLDLCRKGLSDWREGRDVDPQEFIDYFGFRAVQFGEAIPDKERQLIVNSAYDALCDMAHILELEPATLSGNGFLAVAFGARGQGRHPAHYEPTRRILNMGRMNGAGSLAHELAHGLDHAAGEANRTDVTRGQTRYATTSANLSNLSASQRRAFRQVVSILTARDLTKVEAVARTETILADRRAQFQRETARLEAVKSGPRAATHGKFIRDLQRWLDDAEARIRGSEAAVERAKGIPEDGFFGQTATQYLTEAAQLCGKSGDYWKREIELFARAFEAMVFDRLRAIDAASEYLVHSVEEDRYADPSRWKGNPYPVGDERQRFNEAMREVVGAFRELFSRPTPSAAPTP